MKVAVETLVLTIAFFTLDKLMKELLFKFWNLRVSVLFDDSQFSAPLCEMWSNFRVSDREDSNIRYHVRYLKNIFRTRYKLQVNGGESDLSMNKKDVLASLNSQLGYNLIQTIRTRWFFHSSAFLTNDDKIALLMADSGHGKTTMMLGMLQLNKRFICNDLLPLLPHSTVGEPFPVAFFAEESSIKHFDDFQHIPLDFRSRRKRQRSAILLPEKHFSIADQKSYPISMIIFLQRERVGNSDIQKISPSEAIGRLFDNWKNQKLFPGNPLEQLYPIAENSHNFLLRNARLNQSIQLIEEVIDYEKIH